jgi:hypothetical protein
LLWDEPPREINMAIHVQERETSEIYFLELFQKLMG